jgi:hypothetical protein
MIPTLKIKKEKKKIEEKIFEHFNVLVHINSKPGPATSDGFFPKQTHIYFFFI